MRSFLAQKFGEYLGAGLGGQVAQEFVAHPAAASTAVERYLAETKARTTLISGILQEGGVHGMDYTRFSEIAAIMEPSEIHPEVKSRISAAVRRAAERGEQQVLVLQFPSDWCSDKGRAINNSEPDWPKTLTGFAKRAMDYYEKELRQHGYTARAEILNFPGGMPGDVGLFLAWE